ARTVTDFIRFPRTPHLVWLGADAPGDDKLLAPDEADGLLSHEVIVEEKVDGTNIGLSVDEDDMVRVQRRGENVSLDAPHPQFKPLRHWLAMHRLPLVEGLGRTRILFGEWCYARHSVQYDRLPDWFVAFDVFDRAAGRFWSVERRNALLA